ncbi:MAG: FtsX-like permease family protein [Pseudomonadota bacterium]
MIRLALAHMIDRPMPVTLNTLLIAFTGALLLTLASLSTHVRERFDRDMAGIDLVVSAKGSPLQVILSSLFHVDVPTGNIPLEAARKLGKDPLVADAIPIAVGDRFRGFRVVGTRLAYLSLYQAKASTGSVNIEEEHAVVGAAAARTLGISVGQHFAVTHGLAGDGAGAHDAHPLTVSAILQPTGSVIDRLIVTSLDAVWDAHGIEAEDHHDNHEDHEDHEDHDDEDHASEDNRPPEVTALLIRYASPLAAVQLPQKINAQTQLMAAVPAYETARLLSLFGATGDVARIVTTALAMLGGFAIFASLWSALEGRETDVALYRLLGAQPRHIFSLLLLEGVLTAIFGALCAWLIARLCLWRLWSGITSLADSGFSPFVTSPGEAIVLIAIICIGALAALPAAIKAAHTPLERALA